MGRVFFAGGKVDMVDFNFPENFEDAAWNQIIAACQINKVPDTWLTGDQKPMVINGTEYTINIIGRNHDTYTAGGLAPLTFQLLDCYGTTYTMNSTNTNAGGWKDCEMRNIHLPAILELMPEEVQKGIREVNKLSSAGSQSSTIITTADKLFCPSEVEIYNSYSASYAGEGSQYEYYAAGNSKIKKVNGTASVWWERSAWNGGTTAFACVQTNGNSISGVSTGSFGVAFAFCF